MKNIPFIFGFMVAISLLVVGCATGSSAQVNTPVPSSQNGEVNVPGVSIKINVPGPNPLVNTPVRMVKSPAPYWASGMGSSPR